MTKLWMLLLATSLVVGCQAKRELPGSAKQISRDRANALIIMGNSAAYGQIMKLGGGAFGSGSR